MQIITVVKKDNIETFITEVNVKLREGWFKKEPMQMHTNHYGTHYIQMLIKDTEVKE